MYKVYCEITIQHVSSPGTWLPNRDDLYLTVDSFNQVKRTKLSTPNFPLSFHEKFTFEKMFWSCSDPKDVVTAMEDIPVTVELRQVADIYLGGTLLSYFDTNSRDFFYPCPNLCPRSVSNRELLMIRTVDFPGISPKVEFSSYAVIEKLNRCSTNQGDTVRCIKTCRSRRPGPEKTFPLTTTTFKEPRYCKHTVNSALRSRSPSPMDREMAKGHVITDIINHKVKDWQLKYQAGIDDRDPFVVRKVQDDMLMRKPKFHKHCQFNDNMTLRYSKMCHPKCHSPFRIHSPSIEERLDNSKSKRNINRTVRSLSRPVSPTGYNRLSLDSLEHDLIRSRNRRRYP